MSGMWYVGEVVVDLDGNNAIQVKSEHLKRMGWNEQELLNWMQEEEDEELDEVK